MLRRGPALLGIVVIFVLWSMSLLKLLPLRWLNRISLQALRWLNLDRSASVVRDTNSVRNHGREADAETWQP